MSSDVRKAVRCLQSVYTRGDGQEDLF